MKKFFVIFGIFAFVFLVGCGSDKKESEKTDTGDTEAVTDAGDTEETVTDQEPTETEDTETVTDTDPTETEDIETVTDADPTETEDAETVTDADPTETEDAETVTDTDPTEIEDNDPGNVTQDGCTIKTSIGTHSLKRDLTESCIQEIAKANTGSCSWDSGNEEETAKHIAYLQKLKITFGNECKDKNGEDSVECPDFIPETLKLENLSGCDVYSIDPLTDCIAPCTDLYFPTGNDIFHTVYVGDAYGRTFIKSSDSVKEVSFSSELKIGSNKAVFTWSETAEDGTEIEKKVSVEMKVADSNSDTGDD